jgi:phage tail sheath protein FI
VKLANSPTQTQQDNLYDAGVNPVVTFPGEGTFLFGDKTLKSTTSTLSRINVSRLFILMKRDIGRIAKSVLFEQNDTVTRTNFVSQTNAVLRGIQADRGIFDYRIICDETNNPPEKAEANIFVADIFVKPIKSVNFIQLTFTNKNQDADLGSPTE